MHKLLIVDSDEKEAALLSNLLSEKGFKPQFFLTGKDALAALRENRFDAIITELSLSDMKGKNFCGIVRKKFKNMQIIVLTSEDDIDTIQEVLESGADEYIIKPLRLEYLLEKLNLYAIRYPLSAKRI